MAGSPNIVLVHGAWSGGWCYFKVAERLREPTLQILSNFYLGEVYHALVADFEALNGT